MPLRSLVLALALPCAALAEGHAMTPIDTFQGDPMGRWTFVADGVMGGVSQGQAEVAEGAIRLTGLVSTDNNGGFIQVRHRFDGGWPAEAKGLALEARGNGQTYWVFLRTEGLSRVWHSYRHSFEAGPDWAETRLDFANFQPSHDGMPPFDRTRVFSIGIVAYGADFDADVAVRSIALY